MTERMVEANVNESPKGSARSAAPYAGAGRGRRVPNGSLRGWSVWLLEAEIDAIELHQLVDSGARPKVHAKRDGSVAMIVAGSARVTRVDQPLQGRDFASLAVGPKHVVHGLL